MASTKKTPQKGKEKIIHNNPFVVLGVETMEEDNSKVENYNQEVTMEEDDEVEELVPLTQ